MNGYPYIFVEYIFIMQCIFLFFYFLMKIISPHDNSITQAATSPSFPIAGEGTSRGYLSSLLQLLGTQEKFRLE